MIVDLTNTVATLEERVNNERAELKRVEAERVKLADRLVELAQRLAVVEENLKELKRGEEETERRRWTVVMALIGCVLTLAVNIALMYLKR
jgi:septal ring factor EnvC (AmiA/AmiB activator)